MPSEYEQTQQVELPTEVVERVKERLPRTEWEDPSDYITFVMEEVLHHVEQETADDDFQEVDEDEVRDRLKSLGYLDE